MGSSELCPACAVPLLLKAALLLPTSQALNASSAADKPSAAAKRKVEAAIRQ